MIKQLRNFFVINTCSLRHLVFIVDISNKPDLEKCMNKIDLVINKNVIYHLHSICLNFVGEINQKSLIKKILSHT